MVIPDIIETPEGSAVTVEHKDEDELVEWWKDEEEEVDAYKNSAEDASDPLPVILGLVGTGIVCVLLGVFVAPPLLASAFENSLSVTVENTSDLRPLGGVLGLIIAAFIGAIGVWITSSPRR